MVSLPLSFLAYVAISCTFALFFLSKWLSVKKLPLPPGPKPLPLIGNLLDMPRTHACTVFQKWGKEFGDVVYVSFFGKDFIILNSLQAATELIEQHSGNYADRPDMPMLHDPELMDSSWAFPLMRYNPVWKRYRRLFMQYLGPSRAKAFHARQQKASHRLLRSILDEPADYQEHLKFAPASIVLGIAYGFDILPKNDPYLSLGMQMSQNTTEGLGSKFLVNAFSWAKHIPRWIPGTEFHEFAAKARETNKRLLRLPFEVSKEKIDNGTATPCFVGNALPELLETGDSQLQEDIMAVAATIYAAGSDSTVAALTNFVLAMALYPEIQKRAQDELDSVLGAPDSACFRLPAHSDRRHLPYLDAVLKEALRWKPPLGPGVPHAASEEDVYRGWRIPKGATIIANCWGILHDENTYPNPERFKPDRFLPGAGGKKPAPDPALSGVFGFGRRLCAGRHLADDSLWIEIASLLAAFKIAPGKDAEGNEIDISYAARPGPDFVLHPPPFPCTFTPRSNSAVFLIKEASL